MRGSINILRILSGLLLLSIVACKDRSSFKIEGEIEHLRDAELYIYSPDGGIDRIDTIKVQEGSFEWKTPLDNEATFYIIYPNLSEIVIFAKPGDEIEISGDANELKAMKVEGSKENEEFTKFRLAHLQDNESQILKAMQEYIDANGNNRITSYLQRQISLKNVKLSDLKVGNILPPLELPGDSISPADTIQYESKGRPTLVAFWASWHETSHEVNIFVRDALRSTDTLPSDKRLQAVSISLDIDANLYNMYRKQDSIFWPTRCYRQMWSTPQVVQMGIRRLPYVILADSTGTIVALGSDWNSDIKPHLEKIR